MKKLRKQTIGLITGGMGLGAGSAMLGGMGTATATQAQAGLGVAAGYMPLMGNVSGASAALRAVHKLKKGF